MSENKPKLRAKLKPGRKVKHGGFSYLATGKLPEDRRYILQYLTAARENLIRDIGPTEEDLTAAQIILIDRIITKLGVIRCIEEHIRENSVMKGHDLARCLQSSYLAYNNSVRLDLQALGINKRVGEHGDLKGYLQKAYGKGKEDARD